MQKLSKKRLSARICSCMLAALMGASAIVSTGAVAKQTTPSGDTVVRISNPDGKPGDTDGYINDREVGYGWAFAERNGYLYIGGWRNTVGAVIKHYLESALVASGKMDSETVWALTDIITNGEVARPTNPNSGVLIKMNRENPGDFEIITEMTDPFRHVAKYGNDLYFATYVGVSTNDPKIYKLDENDVLTEVYTTAQGSSMRANAILDGKLYFAGTQADEHLKDGETVKLAVIERNEAGDGWNTVADYRDFSYTAEVRNADGTTSEVNGFYGDDSFVAATAGSPFWDMTAYNGELYATIPNMLGYVVFRGHPAKEGEAANDYGWVWTEVVGRDKNSPNNQGFSKTDKLGFTDASSYALGYQSVVGALGTFDGKLYAYDIDHTISAELAGIQGMLLLMTNPENPNLSNYLQPLVTTINHPQTLWRMDADTKTFSEVTGFTELTQGTTNEYIWKHGEYNGEFYISTMDSKVIYNYLTRLTGGSFMEMTLAEKKNQLNYIADFLKKMIVGKLTETEAEQFADQVLTDDSTNEDVTPSKLDELKAKMVKTLTDIAKMEQWQKVLFFCMTYTMTRNIDTEPYENAIKTFTNMQADIESLNLLDSEAVNAFIQKYEDTCSDVVNALQALATDILTNPSAYRLTANEAMQISGLFDEIIDTVKSIFTENFAQEITKMKDIAACISAYNEISKAVNNDKQGFDIFKTADGDNWEVVTDDGFGDKYNYGALRFVTTEEGMYITTANPFFGAQLYLLSNDKGKFLKGDANLDGEVNIYDVTCMQRYLAEYISISDPIALDNADVDCDGTVTLNDISTLQRILAEFE